MSPIKKKDKSGYQKRKEKKEKILKSTEKTKEIKSFFISSKSSKVSENESSTSSNITTNLPCTSKSAYAPKLTKATYIEPSPLIDNNSPRSGNTTLSSISEMDISIISENSILFGETLSPPSLINLDTPTTTSDVAAVSFKEYNLNSEPRPLIDNNSPSTSIIMDNSCLIDETTSSPSATSLISFNSTTTTSDFEATSIITSSALNSNTKPIGKIVKDTAVDLVNILLDEYPTDKAHFSDNPSTEIKRFVVSKGPCKPNSNFKHDADGRHFSSSYYFKLSKAGLKLELSWLCYSNLNDFAYCESCWLFADRSVSNFNDAWIKGIRNWKKISEKIPIHEKSTQHLHACIVYNQWLKNVTVDANLEKQIKDEASYWRKVLDRIINVTLTLAMSNLAFRGHREILNSDEGNCGNFLTIVKLLAKYDDVLDELLKQPVGAINYLSPTIQNELISLVSNKLKQQLSISIQKAPFFSIIIDTTQDVSKIDQLSEIYRYVEIKYDENSKPLEIKINESFLGFSKLDDQSAAGIECHIVNQMKINNLEISKLRGQGYDGAANMSGAYSGVQARILEKAPLAKYVHCAAHNLNLVLNDCVSGIAEIRNFFDIVEKVYVFFGKSIHRWELLSKQYEGKGPKITLKRLCPTRWSSRHDALFALRFRFIDIIKCLTTIVLSSQKADERNEAIAIRKAIENFEFVLNVVVQSKVLETANTVSNILQSKDQDLKSASILLKTACSTIKELRNNFDECKQVAIDLCTVWKIETKFANKRFRKVKRHFDELCEDERLQDAETYYKTMIFYGSLDIMIHQLSVRFESIFSIVEDFLVIQPENLSQLSDDELYHAAEKLVKKYSPDLSDDLPNQLLSLRNCLKDQILALSTVKELAELITIQNVSLTSSFPDVCTACFLFLTIPVTVASAERSFSKLKLIKNYIRSSMGQDRLSGLAILSIENKIARKMDIQELIDIFADQKARKKHI